MTPNPFNLQNKTVVVTGGGSGIGAAIVELFAAVGATVHVGDIDLEGARTTHANSAFWQSIVLHHCDIADRSSVDAMVATVEAQSHIDILVNNAGVGKVGTINETTPQDFDRLYQTNVKGTYNMSSAVMPHFMLRKAGVIVNMASICGLIGVPDRFAYCMTKFAIVGMTKAMAMDHAKHNIRVNCICPGRITTKFMMDRINEYPDPEAIRAAMDASQPMGRMGPPEEVATVALYLASDAARFVTGACESVDGGWYAG